MSSTSSSSFGSQLRRPRLSVDRLPRALLHAERRRRPRRAPPPGRSTGAELARATRHRGTAGRTSAATCSASRVLPTPPTPVSVTTRRVVERVDDLGERRRRGPRTTSPAAAGCPGTRPATATAGTRDASPGAAPGTPAPAAPDPAAGAHPDRPARHRRQRVAHQLARWRCDTTTWPPCADRHQPRRPVHRRCRNSRRRAAPPRRCAPPSAPAAAPVIAHGSRASARCASTAAPTASCAVANAAWNPSPRGLHDVAAVRLDRLAHDLVVARQRAAASPRDAPPTGASNPRDR